MSNKNKSKNQKAVCHVGTSGWQYKHWKELFYPGTLKTKEWLGYYCQHFDCVELNSSFYHQPARKIFEGWGKQVPEGFLYTVKAPRFFTHLKKLSVDKEALLEFIEAAKGLGEHLGPILFQLPPKWHLNLERITEFIELIPKGLKTTFECRDPTWFAPSLYQLFEKHNIAFCIFELGKLKSPVLTTASFVYIRLHGPGQKYKGSYSDQSLMQWADKIEHWMDEGKDVYVFFDNDQAAYAPKDARRLLDNLNKH